MQNEMSKRLMPSDEPAHLYRFESRRYSVIIDADRDLYGVSAPKLELLCFTVTRVTPKGYWIDSFEFPRWVSKTSRKRFAYPTKEEALEGYRQRKLSCLRHNEARVKRAEEDLQLLGGSYKSLLPFGARTHAK